ncbi:hypothetical protein GA830_01270 [Mesorhizobium sp. NBSH29]|uniref:CGNR zinc finger domain-containing protein n=1 Tax=Mesorhizobium sp. NBSH29 TaxID=2654249 RepID=UPI001896984F|nr:CGNR zinc finger domain-containing protein [Mesorhizobium sp. NBSH29]QPC85524.1 hypothetical protein GA830_01270 [Mesorhizobium sp. NBSH29]
MTVAWTSHRFSGGTLALDATNTVVLRGDASRSFDRFDDPGEIARFAHAAERYRADEFGGARLLCREPNLTKPKVLAIRETTDALFRQTVADGALFARALPAFLRACADGLDSVAGPQPGEGITFEAALARSALRLLAPESHLRIRICGNCRWLFLDRSRNGSRLWCDMAVCGNRQKARRNYQRRKEIGKGEAGHG